MTFSEKLALLRRKAGWSQEQLADRLGVTRQSVSKWEGGAALPELGKLIALSELFQVSVDYLVKDRLETPEAAPVPVPQAGTKLEAQVEEISRYFRTLEWESRARVLGLPLVSVCLSAHRTPKAAKGIIAIGNIAVGVLSLGALSVGAVSLGCLSAGILSVGCLAFGGAALGPAAIGLVAFGPAAVGLWYAGGVAALGGKVAVGVAAVGETAVGYDAAGKHVLLWGNGLTAPEVEAFLLEHEPGLHGPLLKALSWMGANLR